MSSLCVLFRFLDFTAYNKSALGFIYNLPLGGPSLHKPKQIFTSVLLKMFLFILFLLIFFM